MINGTADKVVPPTDVTNLSDKLKQQKGITITHKSINGSNHFFEPGMDEMLKTVKEYVRKRLTENTR